MRQRIFIGTVAGVIALLGVPPAANAQRSADNALTNADDAFGTQLGNESNAKGPSRGWSFSGAKHRIFFALHHR